MTATATNLEQVNIVPVHADLFTHADFAHLNKNDTIEDYDAEIAKGPAEYSSERCKVTHVVDLTPEQYTEFCHSLLSNRPWLDGLGGTNSAANVADVEHFYQLSEEDQETWRRHAYRLVVAVGCKGRRTLYVDPQGYRYARYVGV